VQGIPAVVLLFSGASAVSGCLGPFLLGADLLHPASVSSIDVVWSVDRDLCESLVVRSRKSAFLISGNTDEPGFRPSSRGDYWIGSSLSPKDPWRNGNRPDYSIQQFVVKEGATYMYAGKASLPAAETRHLPIPEAERDYADQAIMDVWRESLFRLHGHGAVSKECTFVERRWINWAL
jgi:hypothetical protein